MKAIKKMSSRAVAAILVFCFAFVGLPALSREASAVVTGELTPRTDPSGNLMTAVCTLDNSEYRVGNVYNHEANQATHSLGFGTVKEGDDDRYYVLTGGGGEMYPFRFTARANASENGNVGGADAVMFYFDTTHIRSGNIRLSFRFYLSDLQNTGDYEGEHVKMMMLDEGRSVYTRSLYEAEWKECAVSNTRFDMTENFVGWVYCPLSSFAHKADTECGDESWSSYSPEYSSFNDLIVGNYRYFFGFRFLADGDCYESMTPYIFDDISFVKAGKVHKHTMTEIETVDPTCESVGYTVVECSECGERRRTNVTEAAGHTLGEWKSDKDGTVYALCQNCDRVETSSTLQNAPLGDDDLVTVTLDYGEAADTRIVKFKRGAVIREEDIPLVFCYEEEHGYIAQFNAWTRDADNIEPENPVGTVAAADKTYYARYLIGNYADKYRGAMGVLSNNGGPYNTGTPGSLVVFGASNQSLYWSFASDWSNAGIRTMNNAIAGSTSHDLICYYKAVILQYKPSVILCASCSNDSTYYHMSNRDIMKNLTFFYEETRRLLPETPIVFILGRFLPSRPEFIETVESFNRGIIRFASEHEYCEYSDVFRFGLDQAAQFPDGWDTGTHNNYELLVLFHDLIRRDVLRTIDKYNIKF